MSDRRDYYEVLGVERTVDAAELKRAYRKLAMEHHPDRNPDDKSSEARFKEASEAYQVLSDPEKRARYDRFGHAGMSGGGMGGGFHDVHDIFSAFGDIFGDIFGGRMGGGGRGPARGADLEMRVTLTLAEAFTGVSKEVKVLRRAPCGTCGGTGAAAGTSAETCQHCGGRGQVMHSQGFLMISMACPVCRGEGRVVRKPCNKCDGTGLENQEDKLTITIPAGVEDGNRMQLRGRGEAAPGGTTGDLYIHLRVQPDERFERDGADLHTEVAVSFPQLALGDKVGVPTPDGDGEIEIPSGTQPGERLTLRGRGMPRLDGRGRGNVIAHLKLVVPSSMSVEEEEHLRAYAASGGQRVSPEKGGFFKRKKKR